MVPQEEISESIHERRKLRQLWSHTPAGKTREPGVGAELVQFQNPFYGNCRKKLRDAFKFFTRVK